MLTETNRSWTQLHIKARKGDFKDVKELLEAVKFLVESVAFLPDDITDSKFNPQVYYCHGLEWAYEEMKKLIGECSTFILW